MPRFKVHFPQGLHHSDGFCTLLHHDGMPRHRPSKVRWERGPVLASALERSAQHGVSDIDATAHHICVTATPSTHRFSSQGLLFRLPIWNISYLATVSVVHPPESSLAGLCTWVESPTTSGRALTCTLTRTIINHTRCSFLIPEPKKHHTMHTNYPTKALAMVNV